MAKKVRIFISYAHRDGAPLALRLHPDLEALGYEVWLDQARLRGGDRWTNEIEAALDRADVVLALLSDGSFTSDICRAEQAWALAAGKRVVRIRVQPQAKAQIRMYLLQSLGFTDRASYSQSFAELQTALADPTSTAVVPPAAPYNNTPPLPDNFVERPELLARLRDALFLEGPSAISG